MRKASLKVSPTSSSSSRRSARSASSPGARRPPGNSQAPARWEPGCRRARSSRSPERTTPAATWMGSRAGRDIRLENTGGGLEDEDGSGGKGAFSLAGSTYVIDGYNALRALLPPAMAGGGAAAARRAFEARLRAFRGARPGVRFIVVYDGESGLPGTAPAEKGF